VATIFQWREYWNWRLVVRTEERKTREVSTARTAREFDACSRGKQQAPSWRMDRGTRARNATRRPGRAEREHWQTSSGSSARRAAVMASRDELMSEPATVHGAGDWGCHGLCATRRTNSTTARQPRTMTGSICAQPAGCEDASCPGKSFIAVREIGDRGS
jgi:hypothetical protein